MALAGIVLVSAVYASSQLILLRSFEKLEEKNTQKNVERTLSVLSNEYADLSSKAGDYAEWDETYQFIQDSNEEYIERNLDAPTWANLRVDLSVFIDSSGRIVFGRSYQPDNTVAPIPLSLAELVSANDTLWRHLSVESAITGVINLREAPLLIASRPILTSQHEGPIRGALLIGRYLDFEEMEYLAQTVHLPLSATLLDALDANSDFYTASQSLTQEAPVFVQSLSADRVAGYALISDIYGNSLLILKAEMTRDIYKQGEATITYFMLSIVGIGVIFSAIILIIVEQQVLSRMERLATEVKKIGESKNVSQRLSWSSTDELALLADAIDSMMEQRLKAIEQLAAMVGHDLRNPLTGISNAAYYLRMKTAAGSDSKVTEMLDVIDKDVEYANKIVNDLLEYSRAITLDLKETTPKALLKEALALVNVPANVQVQDFTEDEPRIMVDADKMKRTFVNFLKNAVEAMPEGGKLTIKSKKAKDAVEVSFADTGLGIPKETLARIFIPLFTTKAKGMGFGLAICKRIIEAHGGKISVESTVGEGTKFTLVIPVQPKVEGGDKR
ncbi:MAG: ATP-binding protein [Candidatus Bathyarchaeota archaeon]|nr:ATP-binding protein [Candidatus Bathyarchaeota archaeon]